MGEIAEEGGGEVWVWCCRFKWEGGCLFDRSQSKGWTGFSLGLGIGVGCGFILV